MRPQAGKEQEVIALYDEWNKTRGPNVRGAHAAYLLRPDSQSGELIGVAVFDDRETYRANAEAPAQDAWYRQLRALLEADPQWEDGEFVSGS
jgi:hypothetical protein